MSFFCNFVSLLLFTAASSLLLPVCIAVGADGSVFIGDYELIRKVHPGGNMTTVVDFRLHIHTHL